MRRVAVVGVVLVAAACSLPDVEPVIGETPPSTSTTALVTPWRATSRRIEIFSSQVSFLDALYVKERRDLTSEQVSALARMRTITPQPKPFIDGESYLVRVTDDDGKVETFSSVRSDGLTPVPTIRQTYDGVIDYETLRPFSSPYEDAFRLHRHGRVASRGRPWLQPMPS